MAHIRPPKLWKLGKRETITSYLNWQTAIVFNLTLDDDFTDIMQPNVTWLTRRASATRGYAADPNEVPVGRRMTANQKTARLNILLEFIASYCPVIGRTRILNDLPRLGVYGSV